MLYKFFKYSNFLLDSLTNNRLYFANVEDFNDPFEARFRYKIENLNKKELKNLIIQRISAKAECIEKYLSSPYKLEQKINYLNQYRYENNGVCCFTSYKNLLSVYMWAHYANANKGICIAFDDDIQFVHEADGLNGTRITSPQRYEVKYITEYPQCNPLDIKHFKPQDLLILKQKAWENEEEIRFISPKIGLHYFEKSKIKSIYFGCRLNKEERNTIYSILQNSSYNNVEIYDIILREESFQLDCRAIKPEH